MTVLENVMIGRHCRTQAGVLGRSSGAGRPGRKNRRPSISSYGILEKIGLADQANEFAKQSALRRPSGVWRSPRALATEPFLLLLDEPAAGMNPQETGNLMR